MRKLRPVGLLVCLLLGSCSTAPVAPTPIAIAPSAIPSSPPRPSSPPAVPSSQSPAGGSTNPTPMAHAGMTQPVAPRAGCEIRAINLDPINQYGGDAFQNPPELRSVNGILSTTLTLTWTNPLDTQIAGCPVTLRTYGGKLIGPTLRVKPGDTLRVKVNNQLPPNPETDHDLPLDTPHGFNTTNLHTHGLHVSPVGNSDNVLLEIEPQEDFLIEIKIPPDHPPGTFWYHPHAHGSTAAQVASGMEGALIIEGGLDTVPQISAAKEQIFMFQQIPYSTTGELDLDNYGNTFGPCTWETFQRPHTINGQVNPVLNMNAGEIQRWRFIHGGVRETEAVEVRGPYTGTATLNITDVLALPQQNLHEIAVDGLALGRIDTWQQNQLNPGYRSDVLVQFAQPGTYYVIDGDAQTEALTCNEGFETPSVLTTVIVGSTQQTMSLPSNSDVAKWLPFESIVALVDPDVPTFEAITTQIPGSPLVSTTQVITPNLPIAYGTPITTSKLYSETVKLDGFQKMAFSVTLYGSSPVQFMASDRPFSYDHRRTLTLGNTELWVLETQADSLYFAHPFHIHVNPFQTARPGPDGKPQLLWRDTLLVPQGRPQYVYTQYTDYIGAYVYHCHILDHEDQGMMEIVEIVNP